MPDEVVAPVRRSAWWRRVSGRMDKASTAFSAEMQGIAAPGGRLDDAFFDELTEVLIAADCGVELSERLVAALRHRVRREKLGDGAAAIAALKAEILAVMNTYDRSLHLERRAERGPRGRGQRQRQDHHARQARAPPARGGPQRR